MMPFAKMQEWLDKERALGSPNPDRIVLATTASDGVAHSRVVAIREITNEDILFFTQRGTRKTREIAHNPRASMTLWLPLQQREVMLEGSMTTLSQQENESYWSKRPRESQLRFSAYAQTSGQPLLDPTTLDNNYAALAKQFHDKPIPMSDCYCGYRFIVESFIFFTLNDVNFSEVIQYTRQQKTWHALPLSP